ncbi:MAG: hypothetical protein WDN46_17450 [Methylocella sp.]
MIPIHSRFLSEAVNHNPPVTPTILWVWALDRMVETLQEPYHDFWFQLGKFIHTFALAEAELLLLLKYVSGLSGPKAGALFSGARQEGARDTINNILQATKKNIKKKRLERPFAQLATIGTVRNNLVHWGATHDRGNGESFLVSNEARKPLKPRTYSVTVQDLNDMCDDIIRIVFLMQYEREASDIPLTQRDVFAQKSWLYTPPQPPPPQKGTRRRRHAREE